MLIHIIHIYEQSITPYSTPQADGVLDPLLLDIPSSPLCLCCRAPLWQATLPRCSSYRSAQSKPRAFFFRFGRCSHLPGSGVAHAHVNPLCVLSEIRGRSRARHFLLLFYHFSHFSHFSHLLSSAPHMFPSLQIFICDFPAFSLVCWWNSTSVVARIIRFLVKMLFPENTLQNGGLLRCSFLMRVACTFRKATYPAEGSAP